MGHELVDYCTVAISNHPGENDGGLDKEGVRKGWQKWGGIRIVLGTELVEVAHGLGVSYIGKIENQ